MWRTVPGTGRRPVLALVATLRHALAAMRIRPAFALRE
jgi:hypothetical protein